MLQTLQQVARERTLLITHAYLGHIKRDEDRKVLAHADALVWDQVDPSLKGILTQHLYQAIEGEMGENLFPGMYTGEILSVARVASDDVDRKLNQPTVEILEGVRDMGERMADRFMPQMIEFGNVLAYKIMAAGAIKNHLVAVLKFAIVPSLGAPPIPFSFATVVDLDDREESLFDEFSGKFVTQVLNNAIKRTGIKMGALFPCLDDDGKEMADLLIYGTAAGWFRAMECSRRFSPSQEGKALLKMITEQTIGGEVPHDLFKQMGDDLRHEARDQLDGQPADSLHVDSVIKSLERAVGHGVDRLGFQSRWELTFGDLSYRPSFDALFGGDSVEKPTRMKMATGGIEITLTPGHLENFRQVTVGDQTFILFAVPERAKIVVGKDLDLKIKPVELDGVQVWMTGGEE